MKLQHIDFFPDSFFVGALFPFVEDGKLFLLSVQHLDKYKKGEANNKLPAGPVTEDWLPKRSILLAWRKSSRPCHSIAGLYC